MKLSGWGRYPVIDVRMSAPRDIQDIVAQIQRGNAIARGGGRAYGDSGISRTNTLHMKHFNRMLEFDATSGQLVVEAGVVLGDIIHAFLPRGWFPMVTPGTKFVTVGGMIAADVHGKNHHKDGSFGAFIDWIDIVDAAGEIKRCAPNENEDLFQWTIGGMGLTGVIVRAAIRLRRVDTAWIKQKTLVANNIDHAIDIFEATLDATYSVAWIDCLQSGSQTGRSLVFLGEHAAIVDLPDAQQKRPLFSHPKRKLHIPFNFPDWALNNVAVRAFNALYFKKGQSDAADQLVNWDSYFYPLDAILGWTRIYGKRGFGQFQCVIPLDRSKDGMTALLSEISHSGAGSFLAVLKRFGAQDSKFSFPMEGYTLALDFPINKKTLALMQRLDQITLDHGGRFYLAKDSRMSSDVFLQSDARAAEYMQYRAAHDMVSSFRSAQSERLGIK